MATLNIRDIPVNSVSATFHWSVDYAAETHQRRPFVDESIDDITSDLSVVATTAWQSSETTMAIAIAAAELAAEKFAETIDSHEWRITPRGRKRFRDAPTWRTITDSGRLRDNLSVSVRGG